jgi:hypothetical protein
MTSPPLSTTSSHVASSTISSKGDRCREGKASP